MFGQAVGVIAVDVAFAWAGGAGGIVGLFGADDVFSDLHRELQNQAIASYGVDRQPPGSQTCLGTPIGTSKKARPRIRPSIRDRGRRSDDGRDRAYV
jgi:hypothetical protein